MHPVYYKLREMGKEALVLDSCTSGQSNVPFLILITTLRNSTIFLALPFYVLVGCIQ